MHVNESETFIESVSYVFLFFFLYRHHCLDYSRTIEDRPWQTSRHCDWKHARLLPKQIVVHIMCIHGTQLWHDNSLLPLWYNPCMAMFLRPLQTVMKYYNSCLIQHVITLCPMISLRVWFFLGLRLRRIPIIIAPISPPNYPHKLAKWPCMSFSTMFPFPIHIPNHFVFTFQCKTQVGQVGEVQDMRRRPCAIDGYQTVKDEDERNEGDEVGEDKSSYLDTKIGSAFQDGK